MKIEQGIMIIGILIVTVMAWVGVSFAEPTDQYGGSYADWPASWTAINRLNDPDDGVAEQFDFVGDATNPGAYSASDASYIYLRVRMDIGTATADTWKTGNAGTIFFYIDTDLDGTPNKAVSWDTKAAGHGLEFMTFSSAGTTWNSLLMADVDGNSGQKIIPPDIKYTGGDAYLRSVDGQATTNFETTTFLDLALSKSYYQGQTGRTSIADAEWQLGSVSQETDHKPPSVDVGGGLNPPSPLGGGGGGGAVPEPSSIAISILASVVLAGYRKVRKFLMMK